MPQMPHSKNGLCTFVLPPPNVVAGKVTCIEKVIIEKVSAYPALTIQMKWTTSLILSMLLSSLLWPLHKVTTNKQSTVLSELLPK